MAIKFCAKKSPIHGKGVFATQKISKGELIGIYEGTRTQKDGTYVLWIWQEEETYFGIRGNTPLKYLNHSSRPNAYFDGDHLYALKAIPVDREITFHYGEEWKDVP